MAKEKKETAADPLAGLQFSKFDSTWLRRYAGPIKTIGVNEDGTKFILTQSLKKGTCQIVAGMDFAKDTIKDEEIDRMYADVIMLRKSDLIAFIQSKTK